MRTIWKSATPERWISSRGCGRGSISLWASTATFRPLRSFRFNRITLVDLKVTRCLFKPINRERLAQAVERACKLASNESQTAEERQRISRAVNDAAPPLQQIVARRRDRFVRTAELRDKIKHLRERELEVV
jgi:hypothetical protein